MSDSDHAGFYGNLDRVTFTESTAVLRFYSYTFDTTPGASCVFEITFEEPGFTQHDVEPTGEVEVTVRGLRAEIVDFYNGREIAVLHAKAIASQWVPYDVEDYVRRIHGLDEAYGKVAEELRRATRKNDQALALLREHLRRAELKTAASEHLREKHEASVTVLRQLLRHFESSD